MRAVRPVSQRKIFQKFADPADLLAPGNAADAVSVIIITTGSKVNWKRQKKKEKKKEKKPLEIFKEPADGSRIEWPRIGRAKMAAVQSQIDDSTGDSLNLPIQFFTIQNVI